MAGLSYYLRGAGDDTSKKTVVVRFTHMGNFDRATEAKVAKKDFDKEAGLVKPKVSGAADENKKIDLVRSRFLEVLSWIANDKLKLNLDTFKAKYLELEKHLGVWEKDSHKRKVQLTYNSIADDLYLEIAELEGKLEIARSKLNRILYPGEEREARRLTNAFDLYKEATRKKPLSKSTKRNYTVTCNLFEREHPGLYIDNLNLALLEALRDKLVADGMENSSISEHFIRLKSVLKHYKKKVDKALDLEYLSEVEVGESVNNKPVIFLRQNELDALFELELPKPRQRYVRDLFLLSCFTGLRHVDLHFGEDSITADDYIELFASKTSRRFSVPYLRRAKEIMVRLKENTVEYDPQWVGNFSAAVKNICKLLDCMQIKKSTLLIKNSPKKPRWEMISSKVGRKTFINLCMLSGVPAETVAKWVGHKKTDMIEQHYADHKAISDQERKKLDDAF